MMEAMVLPPDLSRLGDELTSAAARAIATRRHRRAVVVRGALAALAGVLTIAVLTPAALGPAQLAPRPFTAAAPRLPATLVAESVASGCDQARGLHFGLPACGRTAPVEPAPARPMLPHRPVEARI
jgi:hypothetical protein